jgi:hypothetical protein
MSSTTETEALAELEYRGRRHVENLAGLRAMDAHQASEIARLDAKLVAQTDYQDHLPPDADAGTVYSVKKAIIDTELERGLLLEERARLQVELTATPKLIKDNAREIKALKAEARS